MLFCDLPDSVGLAERVGPECMHALLQRFFELALDTLHRYGGTINQFLGDGFMALFGAPLALRITLGVASWRPWRCMRACAHTRQTSGVSRPRQATSHRAKSRDVRGAIPVS